MNLTFAVLVAAAAAAKAPSPLVLVHDIPLPGGPTRFDYQWVDGDRRRLYIAHLGADSLLVFDLDAEKVVGSVGGLPSVHGVVADPEKKRLFATATGDKKLAIIADHSLEVVARVPAGEYPNGLAYAPRQEKVYVSNNAGVGVGVVDVAHAKPLPGIDIGGGAGNTQYDAGSGHVFAAIHRVAALAEIDPATDKVLAQHPLSGVHGCHGLLVDAPRRHAFAACDGKVLVAYDLDKKRTLGTLPIPKQPDVLALDAALGRVYVSSASGFAAAYEVTPTGELHSLGQTMVGPNAHTVSVDPRTHYVFFPLEDVGGRPLLRVMKPREAKPVPPR